LLADAAASSAPKTLNIRTYLFQSLFCSYEQKYKLALEGFRKASELDPTWTEPKQKTDELRKYLDKVSEFVEKKGKLKHKRLQTLIKAIKEKDLGKLGTVQKKNMVAQNCKKKAGPLSDKGQQP